jgi:uncharacterized protein (TIGR03085 family)
VTGIDADNFARTERAALGDTLSELGPDQPTLCTGWQTRDLAAHVVLRDRRPDAAAGIMLKPLAGHTAKVQAALAAKPFEELVEMLRHPPRLSMAGLGPVDRLVNTQEFFIHHEDVRRAQPSWRARALPRQLGLTLWVRSRTAVRFALRRFPAALVIKAPDYGKLRAGAGGPEVRVTGDPGELTLFLAGRQRAADVHLTGPDELVEQLRTKRMGI